MTKKNVFFCTHVDMLEMPDSSLHCVYVSPPLDLLWFPATQMCVGVRSSVPDFVYAIFPTDFHQ